MQVCDVICLEFLNFGCNIAKDDIMNRNILWIPLCIIIIIGMVSCGTRKLEGNDKENLLEIKQKPLYGLNDGRYVVVDTIDSLIVYYPNFSKIDLVCGNMPVKEDTNVVFCAAAAFTGTYMEEFRHTNVAGDHVSGGKRYAGYECRVNTGCFVYYGENKWDFVYGEYSSYLDRAAQAGGMGYAQVMMINKGEIKQTYRVNPRSTKDVNEFRALCELNGKLCVIDSNGFINFIDFVKKLAQVGVNNAIYMDMGEGWNYSWWRHSDGTAVEIHEIPCAYTTNWITFYK